MADGYRAAFIKCPCKHLKCPRGHFDVPARGLITMILLVFQIGGVCSLSDNQVHAPIWHQLAGLTGTGHQTAFPEMCD